MSDPMKNDFPNARRRGLHGWAQWRTEINDRLADSTKAGSPVPDVDPIHKYLKRQLPSRHPANNPEMLMSYSADTEKSTCLESDKYLIYGIPRAKVSTKNAMYRSADELAIERLGHITNKLSLVNTYGGSESSNPDSSGGSYPDRTVPRDYPESDYPMVDMTRSAMDMSHREPNRFAPPRPRNERYYIRSPERKYVGEPMDIQFKTMSDQRYSYYPPQEAKKPRWKDYHRGRESRR